MATSAPDSDDGSAPSDQERVVSLLVGRDCRHCEAGELTRGQYEGSPAVVCSQCSVPQVSFA